MNNEWLNNLRSRMEDHEEGVPDGLWEDISDELFSGEEENNIMANVAPVVNNEEKNEKGKGGTDVGYKSLLYRIGGIAAAAAILVFMMVKMLPQEDKNKTLSKNHSDLNKEADRNSVLKNSEAQEDQNVDENPIMSIPLVKNDFNTAKSGKSIHTLKHESIERKELEKNEKFQVIIDNTGNAEPFGKENKTLPDLPLANETIKAPIDEKETNESLFKKEKLEEKYAENKKEKALKSHKDKSWMLSMLTGNVSSNSAEQQFPGYASMDGKPMNIEAVWSASEYVDDPLTEILLANQSKAVEARIRHKIPVTFGLSLYYNLGKRWGIGTGLNYTKLASELHSGTSTNYIKGDQTVHYIGIPVQVNYNVIQKGKFTGYITGGALVEKQVAGSITTTYVVDDEVKETSKESIDHKPLQFSVNTAVGLQLKVINRLGIYAEPGIGYHFKDDNSPNTIYKEKPLHFNVKFGIRLLID
ncbi:outer membrane beta-barrel protein [Chryseobacterium sp.]|uniref:outer membrane beta-barrel protein n=1 Tax=Chryseobacterium sp. TaxID=1871047 RepID=UPI002FC95CD2